jgi:hypothetical protein
VSEIVKRVEHTTSLWDSFDGLHQYWCVKCYPIATPTLPTLPTPQPSDEVARMTGNVLNAESGEKADVY